MTERQKVRKIQGVPKKSTIIIIMIIEMIILIKKLASECSCVPVSSAHIGCCTDYTVTDKCTLDSEDNKQDKTREEADMTLSPVFPKSSKVVQRCLKVS